MATKEEIKRRVEELSMETVKNVYSGKAYKCCCGCSGIHRYNSRFAKDKFERASVNDRQVKRVINILKAHAADEVSLFDLDDDCYGGRWYVALTLGDRQYIAYTH